MTAREKVIATLGAALQAARELEAEALAARRVAYLARGAETTDDTIKAAHHANADAHDAVCLVLTLERECASMGIKETK